jgi:CBS domain-containing protein
MTTSIIELAATDSCQRAAQVMRDHGVGLVVVTREGRIIEGVITDRDLVVRCMALGGDPTQRQVGDYMDVHPTTVDGDVDLERAVDMMRNAGLRRLPVTTTGTHVIGLLSLDDVALDVKHYIDAFLTVAGRYARKAH